MPELLLELAVRQSTLQRQQLGPVRFVRSEYFAAAAVIVLVDGLGRNVAQSQQVVVNGGYVQVDATEFLIAF